MSISFQQEIPKSRVNITLELETNGSMKKAELPLRLLVMGNFGDCNYNIRVGARKKMAIRHDNFNQVINDLSPSLNFVIPNYFDKTKNELAIHLNFKKINDFRPENIVQQVPELRRLLAMRNLLKELKASVLDNKQLKAELEKIISDQSALKKLRGELNKLEHD